MCECGVSVNLFRVRSADVKAVIDDLVVAVVFWLVVPRCWYYGHNFATDIFKRKFWQVFNC